MKENSLGERLKQARIEKKMTQKEVAGDFITRNMLSQIENGLATPSIKTIEHLAKTLNKPIAYFMETLVDENMTCNENNVIDIDEALVFFESKDYLECKNAVDKIIISIDDNNLPANFREIYYLAWRCSIEVGLKFFLDKDYINAKQLLVDSFLYEKKTPYCDLNIKMNELLLLTKICIYLNQVEEAKQYFSEYEKLYSEYNYQNDSIFVKCELLLKDNKIDECKELLDKETTPALKSSFRYLYFLSVLYFENKEYERAIETFSKLIECSEITLQIRNDINKYIAECYSKTGNYEKAYEFMKKVVNLNNLAH